MNTFLPSLGGLRAFEAAARHVSVKLAAQELNVTPGAVSLQIKDLEANLGVQLFVRHPRRLTLTQQGEDYFSALRAAFRIMREATTRIAAKSRLSPLTVSCTPSFAAQWLVPRLGRFEEHHSGIDIRICASNRTMDFSRDGIDIAIRHGFGRYDGLVSERLLDDELVPVCSPSLLRRDATLTTPADLRYFPLLHDEHRHDWRLWLEAANAPEIDSSRGTVFVDSNGAIESAKAGAGVALVRLSLVKREIAEGSLLIPLTKTIASDLAYYLVYPATALDRPGVATLRTWLLSEITEKDRNKS